jgi:hypothetical protein
MIGSSYYLLPSNLEQTFLRRREPIYTGPKYNKFYDLHRGLDQRTLDVLAASKNEHTPN